MRFWLRFQPQMGSFIHFSNLCMWRLSISRETKVAPLFEGSHGILLYLCQVRAHEPLELFEFLHVVLDDVGADHIQLVQLGDGLAVVGDEGA